ncbi:hypothetical protein ACOSQ2_001632 [Xanthoceras sorbifolium]
MQGGVFCCTEGPYKPYTLTIDLNKFCRMAKVREKRWLLPRLSSKIEIVPFQGHCNLSPSVVRNQRLTLKGWIHTGTHVQGLICSGKAIIGMESWDKNNLIYCAVWLWRSQYKDLSSWNFGRKTLNGTGCYYFGLLYWSSISWWVWNLASFIILCKGSCLLITPVSFFIFVYVWVSLLYILSSYCKYYALLS